MAVEQDLKAWLANREHQRRTQRAIDEFAQDWSRGAVKQRFDQAMATLPDESAEAVADAVRLLFADDEWLDGLIDALALRLAADPFFEPPFRSMNSGIHKGLIVYEDERVVIAAGVTSLAHLAAKKNAARGATSISFSGQVEVLKFVRAGDARLAFWEAPAITAEFTAGNAGSARPAGERRIVDGEIVTIDGRCQSYVIEEAHSNLLLLQASINLDRAPLSVDYDLQRLGFVGCGATGDSASRIQMITTLIRKLDCEGAYEAVAAFLDHPDFFVRWHVMKELLGIDAGAALPHLKRMAARDPHADVRRAARSVLDRFAAPAPASSKAA